MEAYDLDALLVGTYEGRFVWVLQQASTYLLGDFVGDLFADAVMAGWSPYVPPEA